MRKEITHLKTEGAVYKLVGLPRGGSGLKRFVSIMRGLRRRYYTDVLNADAIESLDQIRTISRSVGEHRRYGIQPTFTPESTHCQIHLAEQLSAPPEANAMLVQQRERRLCGPQSISTTESLENDSSEVNLHEDFLAALAG